MHFASRLPFRHISWTGRDGRTRTCKSIIPNCYLLLFASKWRGIPGTIRCYFIDSEVWCRFTNTPKTRRMSIWWTWTTLSSGHTTHRIDFQSIMLPNNFAVARLWRRVRDSNPRRLLHPFRFQGGRNKPDSTNSPKNSTHCFALAILPSLLKPAIHAVAHVL